MVARLIFFFLVLPEIAFSFDNPLERAKKTKRRLGESVDRLGKVSQRLVVWKPSRVGRGVEDWEKEFEEVLKRKPEKKPEKKE